MISTVINKINNGNYIILQTTSRFTFHYTATNQFTSISVINLLLSPKTFQKYPFQNPTTSWHIPGQWWTHRANVDNVLVFLLRAFQNFLKRSFSKCYIHNFISLFCTQLLILLLYIEKPEKPSCNRTLLFFDKINEII